MKPENDSTNKKAAAEHALLPTRRDFVKTAAVAAASIAAGSLISCRSTSSAARTIKIGYVAPKTGMASAFTEADDFVLDQMRKYLADGLMINGTKHPVVILEKDNRSDPNRGAEVASELIKSDKVDIITAACNANNVNPVADQAELNQVPCISNDAPWQAYFMGRGGKPEVGFDWTYHFFWGAEDIVAVYTDLWQMLPTNKVIGALFPDDPEGNTFSAGFAPVLKKLGFTTVDTGRFQATNNDYSAQISAFKKAKTEIITGVLPPPAFTTFWSQAAQQGLKPKIVTMAKALLFPSSVNALGDRGLNLSTEVWWSPYHPFKSGLTGQSAAELCAAYEAGTGRQWLPPLGIKHSLFEVVIDVLKRTKDIDSKNSIMDAIRSTDYHSIMGPVNWNKSPYGNPVKNVCKTPLVGGQWVKGTKYQFNQLVVNDHEAPEIPTQAGLVYMPT
jgi:branched-chain amino acid transport system substrate-binding protein